MLKHVLYALLCSFFSRVDIPAMYNNLDASLDTTVFTQYTQSQEESMYVLFRCISVIISASICFSVLSYLLACVSI